MSNISNAKRVLNYYMRKAWEAGGLRWDSDNEVEVNAIVQDIVDGIKEELLKESGEKEHGKNETD